MRKLACVFTIVIVAASCQPMTITANPDDRTATSGTLGSMKANNRLPTPLPDTSIVIDTLRRP